MKLTIVKAPGVEIELEQVTEVFCPRGYVYFMPDKMSFETFGRTIRDAEREKNEWIRRYENVLQGLKYWREKALEK